MQKKKGLILPDSFNFSETAFKSLMQKRIFKVLIICSNYDYFMLEEDGRIDEQVFDEYVSLNLRYPPIFLQANSPEKAYNIIEEEDIRLIITMLSVGSMDAFDFSQKIKNKYPDKPIVILTPFSREVTLKIARQNLTGIDYVFSWLGDTSILLAIVKLIEDKMNVEHDVTRVGVQTILVVEDSIRFYSSLLPNMYKIIFKQTRETMNEGLNEHRKMLRMRGRPKILLTTTYEEAIDLHTKYKENLLGIISDIAYNRDNVKDYQAGFRLYEYVIADDPYIPFIMASADIKNMQKAEERGISFIYKNSKTLSLELHQYFSKQFVFGDFVFRMPDGSFVDSASDLQSLQKKILQVPNESLEYHVRKNHISKWLNARALFPIAQLLKYVTLDDFHNDMNHAKKFMHDTIASYRLNTGRGVIAKFERDRYDEYLIFSRIGEGSIGGKARGLAFMDSFLKKNRASFNFDNVLVTIPRTVVICTDVFDEFMESNDLYKIGLSDKSDSEILDYFVNACLPKYLHDDFFAFILDINTPIAIRSSSLLEDSHYQPFAGIYSTYMIPNNKGDAETTMTLLATAIKSVYASVYFRSSKAYMEATSNLIDQEKMAIILQEVIGSDYGNRFYPSLSGVARSINFYPIEPEKPVDGIAKIAFGLGKTIVDGGMALRFSPKYPKKILQLSSPEQALCYTQKYFYALDLDKKNFRTSTNEAVNLLKLPVKEAEKDKSLKNTASTYDFQNHIIRDSLNYSGKRIITFAGVLQHDTFPLSRILQTLLSLAQKEMNNPIEIEFAVDVNNPKDSIKVFNLLQIRPIVESNRDGESDIMEIDEDELLIYSEKALGNGVISDIHDIVYIKPGSFNASSSKTIGSNIEQINRRFIDEGRDYILVGPGRWGSSDPWLGIPVKWYQISAARLIIESGLENYRIDPSQGTHFFQNITSFRVGYFTINPYLNDGIFDTDYLAGFAPYFENEYIRHIRFKTPLLVKIDGKRNIGMVCKAKN